MRIGFLTTEYGELGTQRGGLGSYLARSVPRMASLGHECRVYLAIEGDGAGVESGRLIDGVHVIPVPIGSASPIRVRDLPDQVSWHLRSAWHLAERLADDHDGAPCDVIQVPNYGVSGLFVDIPVPIVMRFSSHAPTWHRAAGAPRDLRTVLGEALQRRAIARADALYAPSRFVADLVARDTGRPVEVIATPGDEIGNAPSELVGSGRPYVLHAGQLGRAKGTDLVVEAARHFLSRRPDLDVHACGRNAGHAGLLESLRASFPDRVQLHGPVPREQVRALMAGAVAVLCPSRADNLPNVAIEAMALGTPVIGTRGASLDELVEDGVSGFLVPIDDARGLADAVERISALSSEDLRRMGAAATVRMAGLLDAERTVRAAVRFLESAADGAVPRPFGRHAVARSVHRQIVTAAVGLKLARVVRRLPTLMGGKPASATNGPTAPGRLERTTES